MTEENKIVEVKNECLCQSKWFKKFLVKALAVFVGTYCALSLFAALHKPPMPPCPYGKMMRPPIHQMHHMKKFDKQKKFDIIINNHKIDTKIFSSRYSKTNLYYEYEKHSENSLSEAEYIWIFIKTKEDENKLISESYVIPIKKLRELSNSGKYKKWIGKSGDKLMTFDLTKLSLNKDYYLHSLFCP